MSGASAVPRAARVRFNPRAAAVFGTGYTIDKSFDNSDKIFAKWFAPETRYDKEFYSSTVEVSFEGRNYKAPADYVGELTLMYGDYMKLPPVEERIGHELFQGETIRDLHKDFRDYQAELKTKIISATK